MSKRNEFLTAGVSEKRAKARRQAKAGTPMGDYLEPLAGFAKRIYERIQRGGIPQFAGFSYCDGVPVLLARSKSG